MCFFGWFVLFTSSYDTYGYFFSSLHIICYEFGGGIWEGVGGWVVPRGGSGGERVDEVLKGGGGCRISFVIILGVKR